MKNVFSIFAGVLLLASLQAEACPRTANSFICPGDRVTDSNGNRGIVSGINKFQETVAINYGGNSDSIAGLKSVALGFGCLEGYCVGDLAVDGNGNRGRISAINPFARTVAINYGGSSDAIHHITRVSLGLGCLMGYCIGDNVTDRNGNKGVLDAINTYSQMIAINYGGSSDAIHDITTVANSRYCATYGDAERTVQVFPILIESKYVSLEFKFSATRPIEISEQISSQLK